MSNPAVTANTPRIAVLYNRDSTNPELFNFLDNTIAKLCPDAKYLRSGKSVNPSPDEFWENSNKDTPTLLLIDEEQVEQAPKGEVFKYTDDFKENILKRLFEKTNRVAVVKMQDTTPFTVLDKIPEMLGEDPARTYAEFLSKYPCRDPIKRLPILGLAEAQSTQRRRIRYEGQDPSIEETRSVKEKIEETISNFLTAINYQKPA